MFQWNYQNTFPLTTKIVNKVVIKECNRESELLPKCTETANKSTKPLMELILLRIELSKNVSKTRISKAERILILKELHSKIKLTQSEMTVDPLTRAKCKECKEKRRREAAARNTHRGRYGGQKHTKSRDQSSRSRDGLGR